MNIITKFCSWYIGKQAKAKQDAKKMVDDEQLVKAYHNINALYEFVRFLRTQGFKNRAERKAFWKDVIEGRPVLDDALNRMLQAYGVKSTTIKKLEELRIAKLVAQTKEEMKPKI